jgi:hypothetical protein
VGAGTACGVGRSGREIARNNDMPIVVVKRDDKWVSLPDIILAIEAHSRKKRRI